MHILIRGLLRPNLVTRARLLTPHINLVFRHPQCLLATLDGDLASLPRVTGNIRAPHQHNHHSSSNSGCNSLRKRYHRSRRKSHLHHQI